MLPYERQLEVKQQQVDDALRRIGRLEGFELEPIMPAVEQWRYRNKLEYSFGSGDDGELVCGFHASAGAMRVVGFEDCLLASEQGNSVRELALRWCREQQLEAWERGRGRRHGQGNDDDGDDGTQDAVGQRRRSGADGPAPAA